ncbi:MAG: hypothetical protein JRG70_16870 [Deltaproteobacteria bacterium]|nr:hypothetical protein [Deltaproteobacteria bacterium]
MAVSRGTGARDVDRRADRFGHQVFGCAHVECVAAVRFVAGAFGRDGHVYVVVASTEPAPVLVLLDPCDIDEKGNPGYIVEL